MKIITLDISNVKRIRAVHVEPAGATVILGGRNQQGKTSVLDAIVMALAGGKSIPDVPLRRGETRGEIRVDLGEVAITRTFTEAGGGTLAVEAKVGEATAQVRSPQAWLDARIGALSFDPLDFMRQRPREQAETMRRLVGVDTTALDAERLDAFARRTDLNRQVRDAEGAVRDMPHYPDAPDAPITTEALTEELDAARRVNAIRTAADRQAQDAASRAAAARAAVTGFDSLLPRRRAAPESIIGSMDAEMRRLENLMTTAREALRAAQEDLIRFDAEAEIERKKMIVHARDAEVLASGLLLDATELPTVDEDLVVAKFRGVEGINQQVAANRARAEAGRRAEAIRERASPLTDRLAAIDAEKANLLAGADFPIPGLSFGEDGGVTYRGLPLDQSSGAERIRVSMAVALALNPTLRVVLIRDASLLDTDSLRMVAEMAEERDAQVWLERVGDGDAGAVVIEDGCVREAVGQDADYYKSQRNPVT